MTEAPSTSARARWSLLPLALLPLLVPLATTNFTALGAAQALTANGLSDVKTALVSLLLLAAAGVWAYGVFARGERIRWAREMWLAVALLGLALVSAVAAPNRWPAFFGTYQYRQGFVMMAVVAGIMLLAVQMVRSPSVVRALAVAVVVGGIPVAAYSLVQVAGLDPSYWGAPDWALARGFATLGNPDYLGGYLIFPVTLALGLALQEEHVWLRVFWWGAAGVSATALLLAQVRGAWLGAAVALAVLAAHAVRSRIRLQRADVVALVFALAVLAGAGASAADSIGGRIQEAFSGQTGAGSGRLQIWDMGLDAMSAHPVLGVGPDSYRLAHYEFRGGDHAALGGYATIADDAHSAPIMIGATLGIPALLVALAFWALVMFRAARTTFAGGSGSGRAVFAAWFAAMAGYSVYLIFGPSAITLNVLAALGFGVMLGARAKAGDEGSAAPGAVAVAIIMIALVASVVGVRGLVAEYWFARSMDVIGDPSIARVDRAVSAAPWIFECRAHRANLKGGIAITTGDTARIDAAIAEYESLVSFAPPEYLTYEGFADTLLRLPYSQAFSERALDVARRGIVIYSHGLAARTAASFASIRLGQYGDAIGFLAEDWNTDPAWSEPGITYGYALMDAGRYDDARDVLGWLDEHFPGDDRAEQLRADIAAAEGEGS
ncbi:MAG: hypothetical protein EG823_01490 [Actinobacteria bacterium]|nr:hypothetical protein [Actinomycetota bacterium]